MVQFASFVRRSLLALVNSFLSRFLRYLAYHDERRTRWKQEKTYAQNGELTIWRIMWRKVKW